MSGALWQDRDFALLWAGQTVSDLGSATTLLILPLIAVTTLDASTTEVGLLSAAATVAWFLVPLPAGAVIDRVAKRRLMVVCDVVRCVVAAAVPLAAAFGAARIEHLVVAAFLLGTFTVLFEVSWQSYVPELLPPDRLTEGNSRIATTNAVATVLGPSLAGLAVLLMPAPDVLLIDAASFAASAGTLLLIRARDRRSPPATLPIREHLLGGLRFAWNHPVLRRVVACSATANFFDAITTTLVVVFLVRDLGASSATAGIVLGIGGAGGVVGGLLVRSLASRLGEARMLWLGKLSVGGLTVLIPASASVWMVSAGLFANSFSVVLYNILQITYRQAVCPPELRGRMNAAVRWTIRSVIPLGAILAGLLGDAVGLRPVLLISALGAWLAVGWVVFSPLRHLRDLPLTSR
ncbi:MFS transporter [Actinokineospora globicatena]|uniref:MFS transporter n=1 Tax=Actinokineospora globicatena TaxID=103729 RepID=UPI0020A3E17E|nr:MFS transporter [Actinokineospora globicatena]MCP2303073.1 putative arabinose efflux permease, MFS family [Actinokineospora globicatena]GLW79814.1 MFS transporter [Actinokineospora globicatena]GLW85776.1 MFS transporter [Actinokineospora globicatena]